MQQPGRHVSVANAQFVDIPAATSSPVLCRPLDAAAEVVMICIFVDFHASGVAWTAPADAPPPGLSASHVVGVQAGA